MMEESSEESSDRRPGDDNLLEPQNIYKYKLHKREILGIIIYNNCLITASTD